MAKCKTVSTRNALFTVIMAAAVAALALATLPVEGQPETYRAPRAADGNPDLNGIWQAMNTAHYDVETHMARPAMALREGPVGPVPAAPVLELGAVGAVPGGLSVVEDGSIPYKPEALAKKKENQENWLDRDPEIKCYLPGVPRATYMPYPLQIFHSEKDIFIAYEYAGAVRDIYLDDPGPPPIDSWMGQSVGRWEGETFVIDVHMRIEKEDGTHEDWMVEAGTPNTLLRRGFTKESLMPGTMITVDGYQSKDRTNRANGRDLTFADGKKLFLGSSGTGAPRDGKDPNEPKKEDPRRNSAGQWPVGRVFRALRTS